MCIYTVVPINKSCDINNIPCLNVCKCLVYVGLGVCEISLNAEAEGLIALLYGYVNIVTGLAVPVLDLFNSESLEYRILVLVFDKLLFVCENVCKVCRLCNVLVITVNNDEGSVNDLDLAGPFALISGYYDLCSGNKLCRIILGAHHLVCKICAALVLKICSDLVIPPGLRSLYVCLNYNGSVKLCRDILVVSHGGLNYCYVGNMCVNTVVPVNKSGNINDIASLNGSKCLINLGIRICEISLNAEAEGVHTLLYGYVNVIAGLVILVLYLLDYKTLEGCVLVLVL